MLLEDETEKMVWEYVVERAREDGWCCFLVDHLGKLKTQIENVEIWTFSGIEKTGGGVFSWSSREIENWNF